MIKIFFSVPILLLLFTGCSNSEQKTSIGADAKDTTALNDTSRMEMGNAISISVKPLQLNFRLPAVQSNASAVYDGNWVIIGGKKNGFHGTNNMDSPFQSKMANDSIWVINIETQQAYGVPVPQEYSNLLSSTNPQFYQVGDLLYYCGGFTCKDTGDFQFNWTSDYLFEVSLPDLVSYVKSGGTTPSLNTVFPKVIQNPFLQVTGGGMFVAGNYFYLIGGQNYEGTYSAGLTGAYTNAIRRFTIAENSISDTMSYVDKQNLHRRDLNMVEIVNDRGVLMPMICGGVFTPTGEAYRQPVYISGMYDGTISIAVDTFNQKANQYDCASVTLRNSSVGANYVVLLGGISYVKYDENTQKLVVGDNGIPMPFSNLISILSMGSNSTFAESVQLPSQGGDLLPGYLGSDATFFPNPSYTMEKYGGKILNWKGIIYSDLPATIGYLYGGIASQGPTSGTTPDGPVPTNVNKTLYQVIYNQPQPL